MSALRVLLLLAPPLAALSPSSLGVGIPLVCLALLPAPTVRPHLGRALLAPLSLLLLASVLLGFLSQLWALDAALAAKKSLKFALVALPPTWLALALTPTDREQQIAAARALGIGLAIAAGLLAWQTFGDVVLRDALLGRRTAIPGNKTNVPAAQLAILVWLLPAMLAPLGKRIQRVGMAVLVLMGVTVLAGAGLAPGLAFTVGGVTLGLAHRWPRLVAAAVLMGVLALQGLAPRLMAIEQQFGLVADGSTRHRMDLWALAGEHIAKRPWLGYGLSNSDRIPELPGTMPLSGQRRVFPLYPHNVLMQVQLELGVPGMLLFYAILVELLRRCLAAPAPARASGLALIAATLSVWCVGYPLWRSAWLAWLLFCALALKASLAKRSHATHER